MGDTSRKPSERGNAAPQHARYVLQPPLDAARILHLAQPSRAQTEQPGAFVAGIASEPERRAETRFNVLLFQLRIARIDDVEKHVSEERLLNDEREAIGAVAALRMRDR